VSARRPVTFAADRDASLPATLEQRLDHIERARASLAAEARRLERIGFEDPLRRCHEERRYWNFLAAVHGMAAPGDAPAEDLLRRLVA